MLTIAPLLILTVEVVLGQDNSLAVKEQIYPLDMANKSVDDKYEGCRKNMSDLVYTTLLKNEINENPTFKSAWEEGEKNAKTPADNLNRNHSIAIYVYTSRKVYGFNNAVRSGKHNYKRRLYRWYSLQFLLTEAIQILKETQKQCHLTYRRTKVEFDKDVLNKEVRFGSFTSSSLNETAIKNFGNVSCFEIETCEGAYVAKYSAHLGQKEVLIPPYEKFNVTDIKNNSWCKTVYMLKSLGTKSDLNCNLASVKQTHHRFISHNRGLIAGYHYCVGTHRIGPRGFGLRGVGTHTAGPQGFGPRAAGPQGFGPRAAGPQGFGPRPAGPEGFGPRPAGPEGFGPPPAGPQGFGPRAAGPQGFGPRAAGPQGFGPRPAGPEGFGPPPAGPQGFVPHVFCPREVGTHAAGPDGPVGPLGPDGLHGPRAQ